MNGDRLVNSLLGFLRGLKQRLLEKPTAWWLAQNKYSIDDSCDDDDDDIVTLGTQSPKTWMLIYIWQMDLISHASFY